ncbi:MAG: hypothetical protein WBQ50_01530 [Nocardioides sp.]
MSGHLVALVRHLGVLLLGATIALGAAAVHRVSAVGLPLGLVLAVGASVATAWHLRGSDRPRLASSFCLGWVAVLGLAVRGRPEGDFVVAGDVPGYVVMGTGFVLVAFGVASLVSGPAEPAP